MHVNVMFVCDESLCQYAGQNAHKSCSHHVRQDCPGHMYNITHDSRQYDLRQEVGTVQRGHVSSDSSSHLLIRIGTVSDGSDIKKENLENKISNLSLKNDHKHLKTVKFRHTGRRYVTRHIN